MQYRSSIIPFYPPLTPNTRYTSAEQTNFDLIGQFSPIPWCVDFTHSLFPRTILNSRWPNDSTFQRSRIKTSSIIEEYIIMPMGLSPPKGYFCIGSCTSAISPPVSSWPFRAPEGSTWAACNTRSPQTSFALSKSHPQIIFPVITVRWKDDDDGNCKVFCEAERCFGFWERMLRSEWVVGYPKLNTNANSTWFSIFISV